MGSGPGVDGQRLGVADVGQVGNQLEAVDDTATRRPAALDADAEHAAIAALQVLLGKLVRGVVLEARVRDPGGVRALLQVLGQGEGVLGVPLGAEAEGLEAEEQLLGAEGVQ